MSKFPDDYRMTPEEIEELRQDTKNAQKSATYLALLSQIKRLDLSKAKQLQDVEQKKTEKTNKKMK
ncbi:MULTISPECIES: hypothetical protein [Acinetobacter]|jgi:predicted component of type VI protein secretion system|uniref:Uncharacterized protein n=1 Tax=Acinetobacter haemolyticus TaxID=29430 RepID=A0AAJ2YVY7_ACIHA|nr:MULTISPECIES: hypothetical protein [Acinetobacter]MDH0719804.1 hypothetical protein [Acinetobacter junii]MDX8160876.1 hypothetical protein [Acinetobacter pittii]MDX8265410.1 hypothetical protein [Acinetobacter pittii]MQZ58174.1 hypothetical protein [Acinetobacter junii]NAR28933.1 hypothetical protein [Acinetobacter haemolyticus]